MKKLELEKMKKAYKEKIIKIKRCILNMKRGILFCAKHIRISIKYKGKIIYILLTPTHSNIGDAAIAYGEYQFLQTYFPDYYVTEIGDEYFRWAGNGWLKLICRMIKGNILLLHGGGFLGTLWYETGEVPLRKILHSLKKAPITLLPQTVYYENTEWGQSEFEKSKEIYNACEDLVLCMREQFSYDIAKAAYKNVVLIPDMVLYLTPDKVKINKNGKPNGVLLSLRQDLEKTLSSDMEGEIEKILRKSFQDISRADMIHSENISADMRKDVVIKQLEKFAAAQLVITDRLHGMVFAAISGTPCIVINSKSHKVLGTYKWLGKLPYIEVIKEISEIEGAMKKVMATVDRNYDNSHLLSYYEELGEIIKRNCK